MNNFKISKLIVAIVSIVLLNSCTEDPQPKVIIDFEADNVEILESNSVRFTNSSQHAETYEWEFNGGSPSTSSSESPTVSYNTAGVYSVSLTASNEDNEDTETKTNYIRVIKEANSNFSASSTSISVNSSITFENLSENADSYQWTFEGGEPATSTSQNPSITYKESGSYTVTLIAKNKLSESTESKTAFINVKSAPPLASFTANRNEILKGSSVSFTNNSTNAVSYKWTFQGGNPSTSTSTNPTVSFGNAGNFTVSLEATNQDGETDVESKSNLIEVLNPAVANFSASSTSITEGETINFTNSSSNSNAYSWEFPGGSPATSTELSPNVQYNTPGTYIVSLEAANRLSADSKSISIEVKEDPNFNLEIQSHLYFAIRIFVDDEEIGIVEKETKTFHDIPKAAEKKVSWRIIRQSVGVYLVGNNYDNIYNGGWTLTNPTGNVGLEIDNIVGNTVYVNPVMTNNSNYNLYWDYNFGADWFYTSFDAFVAANAVEESMGYYTLQNIEADLRIFNNKNKTGGGYSWNITTTNIEDKSGRFYAGFTKANGAWRTNIDNWDNQLIIEYYKSKAKAESDPFKGCSKVYRNDQEIQ